MQAFVCCGLEYIITILKFLQVVIHRNLYTIHLVNPISDKFQLRYLLYTLYTFMRNQAPSLPELFRHAGPTLNAYTRILSAFSFFVVGFSI